ncbi:MAG: GIY-YIG nuclease family protein [Halioglobus sp.]
MRKPLTVRGISYPSMAAACREYGLELGTVSARIRKLGMSVDDAFTKPLSKNRGKPLRVNGVKYSSVAAAAKAHGIPSETLAFRLGDGYPPSIAVKTPIGTDKSTIARSPILYRGELFASLAALGDEVGIHYTTLWKRQKEGLSLAEAISLGKIEKGTHNHSHLYIITNCVTGKAYVGLTTMLERRRQAHFAHKPSRTNAALRAGMDKYGKDKFMFSHVFTAFSREGAGRAEKQLLSQLKAEGIELYNRNKGGGKGGKRNYTLWNYYKKHKTDQSPPYKNFSARVTDVGWSMEDAIKYPVGQGTVYGIRFRGENYRTRRDAAKAYCVEVSTVYNRTSKGMTFEQALEDAIDSRHLREAAASARL